MLQAGKVNGQTGSQAAVKQSCPKKMAFSQGRSHRAEDNEVTVPVSTWCGAWLTNTAAALEWSAPLSAASEFIWIALLSESLREIVKNVSAPHI